MKTILDVSSIVYGGHNGNDRRISGFPVGGIRKLFGIINAGLSCSDFALCFDGGKIIKKELLPTYKAGRVPDFSVFAQIDLLKELLLNCNIPFYWDEQYEADDFIFSVCRELVALGDPEDVVIYTDDRDLSCCVTQQIRIAPVTSNGIGINRDCYENRVVNGRVIPYNSILLWKIFHGDSSDNYKALHIPGLTFESFTHEFISQVEPLIGPEGLTVLAYAEYPVFEAVVKMMSNTISPEDAETLLRQGRIAFPYAIPVSNADFTVYAEEFQRGELLYAMERRHMKFFGNGSFERRKFDTYCSLLGLNKTKPARYVSSDSAEAQEFYSLLELRAKELSSGVLAVERYGNKRVSAPREDTLANMDLPL